MKYAHSIARARERYSLDLTIRDFDRMGHLIRGQSPYAFPLAASPDGAVLVAIRHHPRAGKPRWIATVWMGDNILTVLPVEVLTPYRRILRLRKKALRAAGELTTTIVPRRLVAPERIEREVDRAWAAHRAGCAS